MKDVLETTYHLVMRSPADLIESSPPPGVPLVVQRSGRPLPEFSRFLYTAVGGDWWWVDRLGWTYDEWAAHLARHGHETWVASTDGTPAGYFELVWPLTMWSRSHSSDCCRRSPGGASAVTC